MEHEQTISGSAKANPPDAPVIAQRPTDRHMHQVDTIRLITFACVILDHCVAGTTVLTNGFAGGVQMVLHYTRDSFFALTGFVLTYQYRKRDLNVLQFWRRRFKLIGLPYLTWSVFYWALSIWLHWFHETHEQQFRRLIFELYTGTAWYHLYFVFVSMQIYILFPLVLKLLKLTWGYHKWLLLLSLIAHFGITSLVNGQNYHFQTGAFSHLWAHIDATFIPYQFFIFAGMVAAMHYDAFHKFMTRYSVAAIGVGLLGMVAAIAYYMIDIRGHEFPAVANSVFNAHNTVAYMGIILALYGIGILWSTHRTPGSIASRFMTTAADRSFGIYLTHALSLQLLAPLIARIRDAWPQLLVTIPIYLATVLITIIIVEILRRSPISLITTGRPMIRRKVSAPLATAA